MSQEDACTGDLRNHFFFAQIISNCFASFPNSLSPFCLGYATPTPNTNPALHPAATALSAISFQLRQILTCLAAPTSARLETHSPPQPPNHQPSLNGDYVQQSSLLSTQRISEKSHSLVMTPLFSEHVEVCLALPHVDRWSFCDSE